MCLREDTMDALIVGFFANFMFGSIDTMTMFIEGCFRCVEWLSQVTHGNVSLFVFVSIALNLFLINVFTENAKKNK